MTDVTPTLPADHSQLISDLCGIINDYPNGDPELTLSVLAGDATDALDRVGTPEGRRELTGYTILLYATCAYVSARVFSKSLFETYTEALDGFRATLDPASCVCPAGAHPEDLDSEYGAEAGVSMLTEAGRAVFAEEYGLHDEGLAAFDCDGFLAGLADQAADYIREAHEEVFGHIDVSHLDAQFIRDGGGIDVVAMQESIRRTWEHNTGPVALWSARRWLSGQVRDEERLGLFLCMWMGIDQTHAPLPPSYTRDLTAALDTVDLDVSCEHSRHPWSAAGTATESRYRAVVHLYAPGEHPDTPVPAELSARELRECPAHYAELARSALADVEGWSDTYDGEDEDWEG
ncbi:hypothetical protein [Streptomyces sp. DI166]|uniref:hypothetical protein n=1 Tax=Streptomyces sp. DI166 TaxID=1839783 RepID=UPI0021004C7A|nr:hypothetical protein [Streptomyces sp. DI166]